MFDHFERHHIQVAADIRIHCVTAGNPQRPPVLLLHGYPQNLSMWAHVAPTLAERYRVVCADLRGYGDSSKPVCTPSADNYSFRAMAADQVAVMRALGHEQFHVIGHDRGARTSHRMALDHPDRVLSLAVLDIVPTYDMFMRADRRMAAAYWHWYFLQQPAAFLETLIGAAPDVFYETSLVGWGATKLEAFDAQMLAEYRRCWRTREFIHGSSSDYRAAATVDLALDTADLARQVNCPTLALWGTQGHLPKYFDLGAVWAERVATLRCETLDAGHFLIDQQPRETTQALLRHLQTQAP